MSPIDDDLTCRLTDAFNGVHHVLSQIRELLEGSEDAQVAALMDELDLRTLASLKKLRSYLCVPYERPSNGDLS